MHVLLVDHTGHVSGAEYSLHSLIAGLRASGVRCTLACPRGANQALARSHAVEPRTIKATEGSLRLHPIRTPVAVADIAYAATQVARLARSPERRLHPRELDPREPRRRSCQHRLPASRGRPPARPSPRKPSLERQPATHRGNLLARRGELALHRRRARRGRRRQTGHRRWQPRRPRRVQSARRARTESRHAPPLASILGHSRSGVVGQITPWKGQDRRCARSPRLAERHPHLRLLIVGEAKFVSGSTRFDNRAYLDELHALARDERLADRVQLPRRARRRAGDHGCARRAARAVAR